jgi:iron complex outermembrane receptor protein
MKQISVLIVCLLATVPPAHASAEVRAEVRAQAAAQVRVQAAAQVQDSGVVHVVIEESMGMLSGFLVRSGAQRATTDSAGRAALRLPTGRRTIEVTRTGYKAAKITVNVVRDSVVEVRIPVAMSGEMEMEAIVVSATRSERPAADTPLRVELIDEMEVDENTLMSPSGITMLLNETPGLRVHAAAPGLGTGSVRILGLPGQYTAMLADGLPLYGGSASALGPLDISPVDLQRVEIIKGAASSLYGGQSLGGVINMISKPADGTNQLLLNRRMLGVTDAATWLSHTFGETSGISFLAAGTTQSAEDIDDDGWADQAKATRWSVRPRVNLADDNGRTAFITAGYGYDNRDGGTLDNATAPDGSVFHEGLRSRRADIGATASTSRTPRGNFALRAALASSWRDREFGTGPVETDRTSSGFAEVTRLLISRNATTVIGAALQIDRFANELNNAFDHEWTTPGVFVTRENDVGPLKLSASVRVDAHPEAGTQLTERIALLAKPWDEWSIRASVGTGFAPPSAITEETEAVGLRNVHPTVDLETETSRAAMLDITGRLLNAEMLITVYGSDISNPIRLGVNTRGQDNGATLVNADVNSRIGGVEAQAIWRFTGGKLIGTYGYAQGSEEDLMTGQRRIMPMIPRHRVGADLMLEKEGVYRGGVEGIWYGVQSLMDDPYRTKSKPYLYLMAIASRQFGPFELVANFENLLNVRQTDTSPLVRTVPGMAGRWTTDVWAPLEGFMANVAVRYRWQ